MPSSNDKDKKLTSKGTTAASASEKKVVSKPEIVVEQINQLTSKIVGQAENLRHQISDSEIQKSLRELRDASVLFQAMTDNATNSIMQSSNLSTELSRTAISNQLEHQLISGMHPKYIPGQHPASYPKSIPDNGCGCGSGCGDECQPKCCMQIYMSKLNVVQGQFGDGRLELVAAVQAGDTWGLVPGLSSFISVPPGTQGVKLDAPIANICVPCNECLTVPLHGEVMEQSNGSWLGSVLEGRMEVGSAQKSITLRCDCDIAPIAIPIGLTNNEKVKGVVEIEVSAKRVQGGCC